jgi:hypothetical protein
MCLELLLQHYLLLPEKNGNTFAIRAANLILAKPF